MSLRSGLKNSIAALLGPAARLATGRYARIFVYHRFGRQGEPRRLCVEEFARHIRYIAKNFTPRSLQQVVARLQAGQPLEERTAVITVDDGYEDFFEYAYPVLKQHAVPATIYLVTDFVDQKIWLWFDALRAILDGAAVGQYEIEAGGECVRLDLRTLADRNHAWSRLAGHGLRSSPQDQQALVKSAQRSFRVELPAAPDRQYRAMTWEQVRGMSEGIIEVGAHTLSHPILSLCSAEEQRVQIEGSKRLIESRLDRRVQAFSYPNGLASDFTAATTAIVRAAGFSSAVMTYGGLVGRDADPYRLERVSADGLTEFRNCVNGLTHLRRSIGRCRP